MPQQSILAEEFQQHIHHTGIKLGSGALAELENRFLQAKLRAVVAVRGHCVESVGYRNDSGKKMNLLAFETIRIACSIYPLVMLASGTTSWNIDTAERMCAPLSGCFLTSSYSLVLNDLFLRRMSSDVPIFPIS